MIPDFVVCYNPEDRHERTETERFKAFTYDTRQVAARKVRELLQGRTDQG